MLETLQLISLVVATWVAIYGIDAWRREHRGKRQVELAEDALASFYEAVDAIKHIRHPVAFGSEFKDLERQADETVAAFEARKNASVVFVRYAQHKELFSRLYAMRYRFMAQVGPDKAKPFQDIHDVLVSIQSAASTLARLWSRDHFPNSAAYATHQKMVDEYESIFWEGLVEDDPIKPKLDQIVKDMEIICRSVIQGSGTLHSALNWRLFRSRS